MTFEEWAGPEPPRYSKSWYRWEYEREGWDAAIAAEREACAKIAGARSLISIPGTGSANRVPEVMYDPNAAKIAEDIRARGTP